MSSNHNMLPGLPPLHGLGDDDDDALPGTPTTHAGGRGASMRPDTTQTPALPPPQTPYGGFAASRPSETAGTMSSARPYPPLPGTGAPDRTTRNAPDPGWMTGAYPVPGPNEEHPSPRTGQQRAVTEATGGWANITAMMESSTHATSMRMPALRADAASDADDALIDLAASGSDFVASCKAEYERIRSQLDELRALVKQSGMELEKLNQRKVLAASRVREMEERLELYSRQDIRAAYLAASEGEMRVVMITEHREQMQAKLQTFERYEQFLKRAIDELEIQAVAPAPVVDSGLEMGHFAGTMPIEGQWTWPVATGAVPAMPLAALPSPAGHPATTDAVTRAIRAQEQVRQRMAQRLHDGPAQSLANAVLAAEICEKLVQSDPRRALSELANLKGLVNGTLQETRKFIFELRPMTLDDLGLVASLRRYASDVAAKYHVQVPVTGPQTDRRLAPDVEVAVFRVAQEAITNAVEHSRATLIHTTVSLLPDGLVLVVEDNGTGFDVEQALAGAREQRTIGITNMQERAETLGGWLRIESTRGRGTRIELSIPL